MLTSKSPVIKPINRAFLCLLVFLLPGTTVFAATPLQTHDLNPLTLIYGLPLVSPARLPEANQSSFSVSLNASNTINAQENPRETLFIDGETSELNLIYLFPVFDNNFLRLRLPFIGHAAGSLDSFIDDFHQSFGFPDGIRPNYAKNQLLFLYQRDGTEIIRLDQSNRGIGDISIDLAYPLFATSDQAATLWSSIKLPSGDRQTLTGSGNFDVSIWYAAEADFHPDWSHYYNIGLLVPGESKVLPDQQKSHVYFGSLGVEWRAASIVTLNIQLDFHSAFYQSQTRFLGDSVQISSGGHIKLTPSSRLEIVVVEDIQVGASPDVTFHLGYSQIF